MRQSNPSQEQIARACPSPHPRHQVALLRAGSSVEAARRALCALRNLGHERAVCEALTNLYHDQRRERAAAAAAAVAVAVAVAVRKPLQPLHQPLAAGTPEKPRPPGKQRRQQRAAAVWPTVAPLPPAEAAATAAVAMAVAVAATAVAQVQSTERAAAAAAAAAACDEHSAKRARHAPP